VGSNFPRFPENAITWCRTRAEPYNMREQTAYWLMGHIAFYGQYPRVLPRSTAR